ncbi:MAG: hypothetical protein R3D60_01350 [Paracoccaceae bacterium]
MSQKSTDKTTIIETDAALDALFDEARLAEPPALDDGLRARLVAQAIDAQSQRAPAAAPVPSLRARLSALLWGVGGAPGLAGMVSAGVAGVWIGFGGTATTVVDQVIQGAVQASPAVSAWVGDRVPYDDGSEILYIITGMQE